MFIGGKNRVADLEELFKQRAWFAPFKAFSLTTFISGISHVRGLKQSQRAWSAPSFKLLNAFVSVIKRVACLKESFKQHAWSAPLLYLV